MTDTKKVLIFIFLPVSLFAFGYGTLCIIRGYGFNPFERHWYDSFYSGYGPYVGAEATALGIEYIAWAIVIATLVLWPTPGAWLSQLLRVVLFVISVITIMITSWMRDNYGGTIIVPTIMILVKLLIILLSAKSAIQNDS